MKLIFKKYLFYAINIYNSTYLINLKATFILRQRSMKSQLLHVHNHHAYTRNQY
jgi:hypothetical protein